jgi:chlorinating enzyme
MAEILTQGQIDQFREQGFVSPIRVMSAAEASGYRRRLERFERETGGPLGGHLRHKSHLVFTWLADLVRHPRILDAVDDLYGPDLLCWTTNFFIKEKASPAFVSWHQDSTYWSLSQPDAVTAWVAFTPANAGNGAMEVIPGSHKLDQIPHRETFAAHNLLTRGPEIAIEVDQSKAVRLDLEPGDLAAPCAARAWLSAQHLG